MRSIPSDLKAKIEQAFQTIHGNNQPRMEVIAQKVTKYLTEGTMLQARTIRTGNILGPLDICIRRENVNADPTEIVMAYIEDGQAKVATLPYVHRPDEDFVYRYTIGPAVDIACDFDGRWHKITERTGIYFDTAIRWALVTFGEPYIATVRSSGSLHVQQGQYGTSLQLASSGVTKCACLRGWKNVYLWNHDQGVIVAYIRSGTVRYRNYAQQPPSSPALWENEREITELPSPAQNVSIFRTNDYRVGIMCESAGQMHWALTPRNWANMAIEDHYISGTITDVKVDLIPVTEHDYHHDHNISGTITEVSCKLCPPIWPQVVELTNEDEFTILIECDIPLHGDLTGIQSAFTVRDNINTNYTVIATTKINDRFIMLTCSNFEGASGDLTVTYNFETAPVFAQVEGGCFMELSSFVETFTPNLAPPELYTVHTIGGTITGVVVDLKPVTYITPIHNHTVSGTITNVTVTLIHIDDINP